MELVALLRQRDLLPAAFFCFSKKRCDMAADMVQVGWAPCSRKVGVSATPPPPAPPIPPLPHLTPVCPLPLSSPPY
jgi:hypothetical protein